MTLPKVFVASSSEGLPVVDVIHTLLKGTLSKMANVSPWPGEFQLSKAYIESLESLLDTSDFAVMVLTPDDRTKSREAERWSPRDNVVFELGLFIGRLGRERCFLIQRDDVDLKLPSDLLGIEAASFSMSSGQDLESALHSACARIGKAISDATAALPSRPKLSDAERAVQAAGRKLADGLTGTWWERIVLRGEAPALSFFTIKQDYAYSSVRLAGKAYSSDGAQVAIWRSATERIVERKIVYVRECRRLDVETNAWLPGLGELDFDDGADAIDRGEGIFWESEESRPQETVIKTVQVKRNSDDSVTLTMRTGSEKERGALVRDILNSW
jgi:hypothetical protein